MKTIVLVRHATAIEREAGLPDFDRTLIKKGLKESRKTARQFSFYTIIPEIWISSSAPRALETATIFADRIKYPRQDILQEESLYQENSSSAYLTLTQSLPKNKSSVVYFGHEPGISEFAALLVKDFKLDFPKAGILGISMAAESWDRLTDAEGFITFIEFPGSGKEVSKILKTHLTHYLFEENQKILTSLTPKIDKKLKKLLISCSTQVAKSLVKRHTKK